ncbi:MULTISPECIES: OmpP1/FadL family transporter [Methylotenera]|uniref:OmpP1/FadL family transporter n=1 Tax=Methylotenera TaxID=359407 RepID=UPI0003804DD5|nr:MULTISPECIES: outer membrane protein transport protein [Methylotenera]
MTSSAKLLPLLLIIFSAESFATDGYFSHGYGVKSQGIGGVGIAFPQDALAAATNPAGLGLVGDRVDFGLTWFKPEREAEISGNAFPGVDGTYSANDTKHFFIPEFGYNRQVNPNLTLGVSVYGNGGMNSDYKDGIPLFGSQGSAGVDLIQVFAAPTATWKVTPSQTIGVSVNLAYQRFEVKGLQGFSGFSTSPNDLTNRGHDNSYGAGLHVGWIGEITDTVTLGATYQSRTYMTKFDKYKGLFAEQGDFDIPSTYGVGIAVKATPKLTIAADYQRINYNEVDAVGNASLQNLPNGLGSDNGAGFGWKDANIYKLGFSYAYSDDLTLRAGLNHVDQPIGKGDTLLNTLAPAVVKDHLSLGATWVLANKSELSFVYTHAFENTVNGSNSIPPGFPPSGLGGGEADLKMYQNSLGIAYGWKL